MSDNITVQETERMYESVVTDLGNELMMNAVANGKKVTITQFAVGDGNGEYYRPETTMTKLKNETWRGNISSCRVSPEAKNILIVTAVCPGDVGGFTVREMGVFDTNNNMIAVCNCPATPKVAITDGVVNEVCLEMELVLLNGDSVQLVVDPYIVTATKKDIQEIWDELDSRSKVTIGTEDEELEENEIRLVVAEMPY